MRAALFALLLTTAPALAGDGLPNIKGMPYPQAKQAMLRAGWAGGPTPMDLKHCDAGYESFCQMSETLQCNGETCTFIFWKGSGRNERLARIDTFGDAVSGQKVEGAMIMRESERRKLGI